MLSDIATMLSTLQECDMTLDNAKRYRDNGKLHCDMTLDNTKRHCDNAK